MSPAVRELARLPGFLQAASMIPRPILLPLILLGLAGSLQSGGADNSLDDYFRRETDRIAGQAFAGVTNRASWEARRPILREQLLDMLGLWPMPDRTALKPVVVGTLEHEGVVVERLHFQSIPGLYVTANLYRPTQRVGRLPAVLYVCGHAQVRTNGLSCGNKVGYQHHGLWFARHGYVALLIDTLQLGEIEGVHHGTHRLGQWWWNSRGYTPAGVEAWNGIRALDYLESRPEVDPARLGMTGRSGGGSYTWTTAAVDDRVRVAAPVAGITDLHNQVVDGVIAGHCDCMFFLNRHRWDFGLNAALLAPRPLLLVNTDNDTIFPLDGVERIHAQVRQVYGLLGAADHLGLVIGPGPHQDTQDLQVPVFRWFSRHLQGEEAVITEAARKVFDPLALRVFGDLPADERNTTAAEWFPDRPARDEVRWEGDGWRRVLERVRARVFGGWPGEPASLPTVHLREVVARGDRRERAWDIETQAGITLGIRVLQDERRAPRRVVLSVLEPDGWDAWSREAAQAGAGVVAVGFVPRGLGPASTDAERKEHVHLRRRFMLLGQTLDGMRVWDIRRAAQWVRRTYGRALPLEIRGEGADAVNALLTGLFEPDVSTVALTRLPVSLRSGPDYLGLLEFGDIPWLRRLARDRGLEVREATP